MAHLRIICVGKLKKPFWRQAAEHYLSSLSRLIKAELVEVRDAPGSLPGAERPAVEGAAVLERLGPGDMPIALDMRGKALSSEALAKRLGGWLDDPACTPSFIVGGAYGLPPEVTRPAGRRSEMLSLGPMTLPHELARVVLLEQVYRAASILRGLPYHHG